MKIISETWSDISMVFEVTSDFIIQWAVIYDVDDWRDSSLVRQLLALPQSDLESCIVEFDCRKVLWIKHYSGFSGGVAIMPCIGGTGIALIEEAAKFVNYAEMTMQLAYQIRPMWSVSGGKIDNSDKK